MSFNPEEGRFVLIYQEILNLAWILLQQQTVKENHIANTN